MSSRAAGGGLERADRGLTPQSTLCAIGSRRMSTPDRTRRRRAPRPDPSSRPPEQLRAPRRRGPEAVADGRNRWRGSSGRSRGRRSRSRSSSAGGGIFAGVIFVIAAICIGELFGMAKAARPFPLVAMLATGWDDRRRLLRRPVPDGPGADGDVSGPVRLRRSARPDLRRDGRRGCDRPRHRMDRSAVRPRCAPSGAARPRRGSSHRRPGRDDRRRHRRIRRRPGLRASSPRGGRSRRRRPSRASSSASREAPPPSGSPGSTRTGCRARTRSQSAQSSPWSRRSETFSSRW